MARPAAASSALDSGAAELGRHLGAHLLPGGEAHGEPDGGQVHGLVGQRAQPHLDPFVPRIPHRDVLELVGVEVGAELGVQHREDVLVELGGDAGVVVVRGDQHGRILDQVGAEQEEVAGAQPGPDPGQERGALIGQQVPDRAAQEGDQPGGGRVAVRGEPQVLLEVGDHGAHVQARVLRGQRVTRRDQGRLADVHRHVAAQRARRAQRVQQQPGLVRGPRAELDERPGPRLPGDLGRGGVQDLPFGAGRVVLAQLGDLVEQRAALRVVEPLGRQRLRVRREPAARVGAQRFGEEAGRQPAVK